jgi:hypothetical protein
MKLENYLLKKLHVDAEKQPSQQKIKERNVKGGKQTPKAINNNQNPNDST